MSIISAKKRSVAPDYERLLIVPRIYVDEYSAIFVSGSLNPLPTTRWLMIYSLYECLF